MAKEKRRPLSRTAFRCNHRRSTLPDGRGFRRRGLPVQRDVHGESPAVVVVVVVIDQQKQTTISRRRPRQRAADEERLAGLTIHCAEVADQCADTGTRDWPRTDDRAEACAATALGSDSACTLTGDDSTGGRERDLITGAYINARVNPARVPRHANVAFDSSRPAPWSARKAISRTDAGAAIIVDVPRADSSFA